MSWWLVAILLSGTTPRSPAETSVEPFARRACKFGPLPETFDEGFHRSDRSAYIGDVFGLPAVALARGGHNISGTASGGSMLGLAVQVPFATSAVISVLLIQGDEVRKCRLTWGAGGRYKQCVFERAPLRDGNFIISFRVAGLGEALQPMEGLANPSSCILIRVDLKIGSSLIEHLSCSVMNQLGQPLGSASPAIMPTKFRMPVLGGGVVWSSPIPRSADLTHMQVLFARLSFPFLAQPMQLLLEEVSCSQSAGPSPQTPTCKLRCVSGTPETQVGQIMDRALAPSSCYMLYILASEQDTCVEFEFELSLTLREASALQQRYIGPPAWLCDGSSWPSLLEQSQRTQGNDPVTLQEPVVDDEPFKISARRFHLHDIFELTRLMPLRIPSSKGAAVPAYGGVHALRIVVSERSRLRVSTHAATVAVRPVLTRGSAQDAMSQHIVRLPTARVPAAGGEFWHGIHQDLEPGTYSLVFVVDHLLGGLRPCSTVLLRLEMAPIADLQEDQAESGIATIRPGACPYDPASSFLQDQLNRALSPSDTYFDRSQDYQVTLPGTLQLNEDTRNMAILKDTDDVAILARASIDLSSSVQAPVLLRIKVTSQYLGADLHVQVYFEGVPVAEPQLAADGSGYLSIVGPLSRRGAYDVVLFHVPKVMPQQCATFSLDISSVLAAPESQGGAVVPQTALLPGSAICRIIASELPNAVTVAPGRPALIDGEFVLPATGRVDIQFSSTRGAFVLHAIVSSADAELRLVASSSTDASTPSLLGLAEDRVVFYASPGSGPGPTGVTLTLVVARLPTQSVCPTLHLHVVALQATEVPLCPWESDKFRQDSRLSDTLQRDLQSALTSQKVESAQLRVYSALAPATGLDVVAVFDVVAPTSELRVDFGLEYMWTPLEAIIQGLRGKSWGRVMARGRAAGQRLVIRAPALPKGRYRLRLRTWTSGVDISFKSFDVERPRCSFLTYSVALLDTANKDTANFRQEMLTNPELHGVVRMPSSLTPWWVKPDDDFVRSQVYRVPVQGATVSVTVRESSMMRILAEPANILTPHLDLVVNLGSEFVVTGTQLIGSASIPLDQIGTYTLIFKPRCPNCPCVGDCPEQDLPFMFTLGISSKAMLTSSDNTASSCPMTIDRVEVGSAPAGEESVHYWHRKQDMRVANRLQGDLQVPLRVTRPAVVLFAAWSPFTHRYIRVGLKTEEGLWVGEQRNYRSGLEIELAPGEYNLLVSEPTPVWSSGWDMGHCLTFGLSVTVSGFSMPVPPGGKLSAHNAPLGLGSTGTRAASAVQARGLGARCDALGAAPLPLDIYSKAGGSHCYGGPADPSGRLLVRHRMLLTDIHDGRKKVYLKPPYDSLMRVAVVSADAAEVEVVVETAQHVPLSPADVWPHSSGGWSLSYLFQGYDDGGLWISLHREHRDALASGCAGFDLLVQVSLLADIAKMTECPAGEGFLGGGMGVSSADFVRSAKQKGSAIEYVRGDTFSEVVTVDVAVASLVEVEVQYNLMLSDIDLQLQDVEPHLQVGAENGAVHAEDSQLNMHSVLRLRLDPGSYKVVIQHVSALPGTVNHGACVPLGLAFLQRPWASDTNNVMTSYSIDPSVPVSIGSDLVVVAVQSRPSARLLPVVAGMVPTGMADVAGGVVAIWDQDTLTAGKDSQQSRNLVVLGHQMRALPLQFDESSGKEGALVLLPTDWSVSGRSPWSGIPKELPSFNIEMQILKADYSVAQIQAPKLQRAVPESGTLRAEQHSPRADFGSSFDLTPPAGITGKALPPSPGSHSNSVPVVCWLVLLALGAYTGRHTLASIFEDFFQAWKAGTWTLSGFQPARPTGEMHSVVEVTSQITRRSSHGYGTVL